jgi:hypothetical protein
MQYTASTAAAAATTDTRSTVRLLSDLANVERVCTRMAVSRRRSKANVDANVLALCTSSIENRRGRRQRESMSNTTHHALAWNIENAALVKTSTSKV